MGVASQRRGRGLLNGGGASVRFRRRGRRPRGVKVAEAEVAFDGRGDRRHRHHGGQRGLPRTGPVSASPLSCPHAAPRLSPGLGASRELPRLAAAAWGPVLPAAAGPGRALTAAALRRSLH